MLVRLAVAAVLAALAPLARATPAAGAGDLAPSASAAPVAVAVDLARLDAPALQPTALLGQLFDRLVEAGFAIVAPERAPAIRIELLRDGGEVIASATGGGRTTIRRIALDDAVGEVQLEIVHKVVEQVRELAVTTIADESGGPESAPAPSVALDRAPERGSIDGSTAAIARPAPASGLVVALGAGYRVRAGQRGPLLDLRARLGGRLAIGFALDRAASDGGGVAVTEWSLRAGPSLALLTAGPLELRAALALGAATHAFEVASDMVVTRPAGDRLDLLTALGLTAALRAGRWSAALAVTGAAVDQRRRHLAGDRVLWSAGRSRLDTTLSIAAEL